MKKYSLNDWRCPKCRHSSTSLSLESTMLFGGRDYILWVTCASCGYLEEMYTADYEEEGFCGKQRV